MTMEVPWRGMAIEITTNVSTDVPDVSSTHCHFPVILH